MTTTSTSYATTTPNTSTPATSSALEDLTLDYDAFLTLMIQQMKNQDPTDPMDSTEQLSQLATFSQVEQSIQTNSKLDSLLTNLSFSQAGDLIGRTATAANGTTGVITSVEVYSDGTVLGLEDGSGILLGPGVAIS
ncbi:flagellar basal-body rod modification protein FlgD [Breoghania corrubedonensis]|uniref:Basal-body rod modification protein FlgD n=1 Tax=Breoghania corrubedonensis TaxID=665038 RepID=A0A2T5V8T8_9HYPH|nr:flagellar hook assembly protein FlgD [Breoghania corrubedonensis]PTW60167.1 flagellar basal-body rod modification protein FlgD [Breoghania corrubedonensis]